MATEDLNTAIQLIQQGQSEQAQPILQTIIRANPQDLTAWSWYVKSCATPQKRLQALETCLKLNPGNQQLIEAIDVMRARLSSQQPAATPAVAPISAPVQPFSSDAPSYYENSYQQYEMPPAGMPTAETIAVMAEPSGDLPGLLLPDEPVSRPFAWYEVWFRALTQVNAPSYFELLRDPTAEPGRAYLWLFIANLIAGLVLFVSIVFLRSSLISSLEQAGLLPGSVLDSNILFPVLLLLIPVGSALNVFGTVLTVAIYNLFARMLGGSGNFSRTIYLVGAYAAPIIILDSVLSMIPLVACLTLPLGLYAFWMSVHAVQAAHRITATGRAAIVILIPAIIGMVLACLIFLAGSQYFLGILRSQTGVY